MARTDRQLLELLIRDNKHPESVYGGVLQDLRDLREAVKWRRIETAPLDGSHILLYRPEVQSVGYYGGPRTGWRINAPGLPVIDPLPTHWMPLPKMPKPQEASDDESNG